MWKIKFQSPKDPTCKNDLKTRPEAFTQLHERLKFVFHCEWTRLHEKPFFLPSGSCNNTKSASADGAISTGSSMNGGIMAEEIVVEIH